MTRLPDGEVLFSVGDLPYWDPLLGPSAPFLLIGALVFVLPSIARWFPLYGLSGRLYGRAAGRTAIILTMTIYIGHSTVEVVYLHSAKSNFENADFHVISTTYDGADGGGFPHLDRVHGLIFGAEVLTLPGAIQGWTRARRISNRLTPGERLLLARHGDTVLAIVRPTT